MRVLKQQATRIRQAEANGYLVNAAKQIQIISLLKQQINIKQQKTKVVFDKIEHNNTTRMRLYLVRNIKLLLLI